MWILEKLTNYLKWVGGKKIWFDFEWVWFLFKERKKFGRKRANPIDQIELKYCQLNDFFSSSWTELNKWIDLKWTNEKKKCNVCPQHIWWLLNELYLHTHAHKKTFFFLKTNEKDEKAAKKAKQKQKITVAPAIISGRRLCSFLYFMTKPKLNLWFGGEYECKYLWGERTGSQLLFFFFLFRT